MRTLSRWALTPLAALLLAACGDRGDGAEGNNTEVAGAASNRTLAAEADGALGRVIANAELGTVLEGVGPYTVLAPPDAALRDFAEPARKAEAVALLRAHMLPGVVTRQDIGAAIDRAGADGVEMRTMAGGLLTFTRDGDAIVATAPDGARARFTGDEAQASNGVLQPVDGLLVKPEATES